MPMATMMVKEIIVAAADGRRCTSGGAFLPDRKMHGAMHLSDRVQLLRLLFERANEMHDLQHRSRFFRANLTQQFFSTHGGKRGCWRCHLLSAFVRSMISSVRYQVVLAPVLPSAQRMRCQPVNIEPRLLEGAAIASAAQWLDDKPQYSSRKSVPTVLR